MWVRELFNPMGVSQSFSGLTTFLDGDNCKIVNKTKQDEAVLLHLRREEDGVEGHAYMRPQKQFAPIAEQLLNWAFAEPKIVGLTVNELANLDTGLSVSSVGGKMQLS